MRTQLLTSCVRRHVTKDVTYTKIHPERYYFCVVFGGGHFRSVTDSRKKHHGTIPHLITTQRVSGCVHPRDVTQNKYVQHTCTFFCNLVTRAGVSTSGATLEKHTERKSLQTSLPVQIPQSLKVTATSNSTRQPSNSRLQALK